MPPYFKEFFKLYLEAQGKENKQEIPWEDRLAALYYAYAMKNANKFVSDWFCLNLNINNMLTAITCRKHGFDKAGYIVGDNEVAQALRTSMPVISGWETRWIICLISGVLLRKRI